jgi:hypothetical protein
MENVPSRRFQTQENREISLISLSLKVLDENAGRPCGNPFKVRAVWENPLCTIQGFREIGTGLAVGLGRDMSFHVESLIGGVYVLSHRIAQDGEIIVAVINTRGASVKDLGGEAIEFATISIVEQSIKPVRFIEAKDGMRVIVGGPKEIGKDV